jgi:hypothetical protein
MSKHINWRHDRADQASTNPKVSHVNNSEFIDNHSAMKDLIFYGGESKIEMSSNQSTHGVKDGYQIVDN